MQRIDDEGLRSTRPSRARRIARGAAYTLGGLVLLALLAAAGVYAASERIIRRTYDVPLAAVAIPADPAALAEGRRLAKVGGCEGCHGEELKGRVFFDEPMLARLVAPNLTQVVARHSDAELERVIRQGIRANGRSTIGMPSAMFHHLSDADLGALIAFLRSVPPSDGPGTEIRVGPIGRVGIVLGQYKPQAMLIDHSDRAPAARDTTDALSLGRYVALTACTECHGQDLRGSPDGAPNLAIAAAYPESEFARLMRTGIALGDRELQLMSRVARGRFSHLTDAEVRALHAYLSTLR